MTDIHFLLFSNSVGGDQENTGLCDHGATSISERADSQSEQSVVPGGTKTHSASQQRDLAVTRRPCGCGVQRVVAANLVEEEEILRKPLLISDAFGEL